jgi:hypothetical protein
MHAESTLFCLTTPLEQLAVDAQAWLQGFLGNSDLNLNDTLRLASIW